jgi:sugar fermentation stimulation protein A
MPARLIARENRFRILADVQGRSVALACRDPGRMTRILVPGAHLRVSLEDVPGRRTRGTVWLVRDGRGWVSVVPTLANRVFAAALEAKALPGLAGARVLAAEVPWGHSRFDFALRYRGRDWLAEIKSVGVVEDSAALFPDAPTRRGARHVSELAAHARDGGAALVGFVAQRGDARALRIDARVDPELASVVSDAAREGVLFKAWACEVVPSGVRVARRIPLLAPVH